MVRRAEAERAGLGRAAPAVASADPRLVVLSSPPIRRAPSCVYVVT